MVPAHLLFLQDGLDGQQEPQSVQLVDKQSDDVAIHLRASDASHSKLQEQGANPGAYSICYSQLSHRSHS